MIARNKAGLMSLIIIGLFDNKYMARVGWLN